MAKDKGPRRTGRRSSMAALEDTDPMTREELMEAFGRSGSEPGMADRQQPQRQPADQRTGRP